MKETDMVEGDVRIFELVMPEEFGRKRVQNLKHPELHRAIQEMKGMPVGRGVKLRCGGARQDAVRKQKAAMAIARRRRIAIRTMLRSGWLFLERIKDRREPASPAVLRPE